MIMITSSNLETLNELYLHDMELLDIKVDYFGHKVEVHLCDEQKNKHDMIFEHMQYFLLTEFEPWGEGMYISEVKSTTTGIESLVKMADDCIINTDAFMTEVILNSGDKIAIISSKIQYI